MTLADNLINQMVGIPWKVGGKNPKEGFDCWGFFKWFYSEFADIQIAEDGEQIKPSETKKMIKAFSKAKGSGQWKNILAPVDFCAVALSKNKKIHHVGVWFNGGCLHAVEGIGVVYNTVMHLNRNGFNKVEFYEYAKADN